jgi:hypothetical protein
VAGDSLNWVSIRGDRGSWILGGVLILSMASFVLGQEGLRSMAVISAAGKITTSPALPLYRTARDFGLALGLIASWLVGICYIRTGKRGQGAVLVVLGLAFVGFGIGLPLYGRAVILKMLRDFNQTHSQSVAELARALARVDLSEKNRAFLQQAYVDELHMLRGSSEYEAVGGNQTEVEPSKTAARVQQLHETLKPLPGALARTATLWSGVWMLSALAGVFWPLSARARPAT